MAITTLSGLELPIRPLYRVPLHSFNAGGGRRTASNVTKPARLRTSDPPPLSAPTPLTSCARLKRAAPDAIYLPMLGNRYPIGRLCFPPVRAPPSALLQVETYSPEKYSMLTERRWRWKCGY